MKIKLLSLISLVCFFSSCNYVSKESNEIIKKKVILENRKQIREAIIGKDKLNEGNYYDLYTAGMFYFTDANLKKEIDDPEYSKDIEMARVCFNKAVDLNNRLAIAYKGLFMVYNFLGDDLNAINNIQNAIAKKPNDFDALFMLGNFYYNKADYKNAVVWLEEAEKIAEADPRLYGDMDRKGFKKMILKAKMQSKY
jgi:tetratricopeptide (TPR) repeat protein